MKALIFLLTANVVFAANMAPADAQRLNVLFITSDDLGLQLSCYGETRIATPNPEAVGCMS